MPTRVHLPDAAAAAAAAAGNNHDHDVEAGWATQEGEEFTDPFDIANTKNASVESLKRWRVRFSHNAASNVYPLFIYTIFQDSHNLHVLGIPFDCLFNLVGMDIELFQCRIVGFFFIKQIVGHNLALSIVRQPCTKWIEKWPIQL